MRTALLAWPAGHSLSPPMHNAAFSETGLRATYEALAVPPEELGEVLTELRSGGWLGANVSIPHKVAVLNHLDQVSPEAQRIGAVNTVVVRAGELHGYNTDASGFLRGLRDIGEVTAGQHALVLGAGGAARAVCYALLNAGVTVHLTNRTPEKADQLASEFADLGTITAGEIPVAAFDIVVNTTAVGMAGGPAPDALPLAREVLAGLPRTALVSDLVYRPAVTPLLRRAEELGFAHHQNGLAMLLWQGVEAFELFTGIDASVAVMAAALTESLDM